MAILTLDALTKALEDHRDLGQAFERFNTKKLLRAVEVAGDAFPHIEGRIAPGKGASTLDASDALIRGAWQFSLGWVHEEMDRTGFTKVIGELSLSYLAEFDLRSGEMLEAELAAVQRFPNARFTREDIHAVASLAEKHRQFFLVRVSQEGICASTIFHGHESPGAKEAGAFLGAVNLAGALAPEPFVSKGIAVASVITGFIAQWF